MTMMSQLALLEHPATPELLTEQWLSSIWRLWVAKVLAAHGAVQLRGYIKDTSIAARGGGGSFKKVKYRNQKNMCL